MTSAARKTPVQLFTRWLGLPDDPDAEELARRLERLHQLDDLTRYRVTRVLRDCLADMLGDEQHVEAA